MSDFKQKVNENIHEEIKRVIGMLHINTDKYQDVHEYKALTDSLRLLISMESRKTIGVITKEDVKFYQSILKNLEHKENVLSKITKNVLSSGETKLYRDWLISYDRIIKCYNDVENLIKSYEFRINNLKQDLQRIEHYLQEAKKNNEKDKINTLERQRENLINEISSLE